MRGHRVSTAPSSIIPWNNDIVEDALAGYLDEVTVVRATPDSRYDDLKSGRVKTIDGEEFFRQLREKSQRRRSC
jgi:hypothetical protein